MTQTNHVQGNPPPLTIVQPGEREVTASLAGSVLLSSCGDATPTGWFPWLNTHLQSGPRGAAPAHREDEYSIVTEGEIGDPVAGKWSSVPAATSPNLAAKCTPCGTQVRSRHE